MGRRGGGGGGRGDAKARRTESENREGCCWSIDTLLLIPRGASRSYFSFYIDDKGAITERHVKMIILRCI